MTATTTNRTTDYAQQIATHLGPQWRAGTTDYGATLTTDDGARIDISAHLTATPKLPQGTPRHVLLAHGLPTRNLHQLAIDIPFGATAEQAADLLRDTVLPGYLYLLGQAASQAQAQARREAEVSQVLAAFIDTIAPAASIRSNGPSGAAFVCRALNHTPPRGSLDVQYAAGDREPTTTLTLQGLDVATTQALLHCLAAMETART